MVIQTCIVHLIRHSMDFAAWKDRKNVAQALRTVYRAADAKIGGAALDAFAQSPWGESIRRSRRAGAATGTLSFRSFYPEGVRKIIHTTNAIEALNSNLRRAIRTRGHFPSDDAAAKLLFGFEPCGCGLETAAARVVRGEDPVRRYVQTALRARMTENRLTHKNSDSPAASRASQGGNPCYPDQEISLTDADARSMATSGRGSGIVGYNVQIAVEANHHLIVMNR